MAAVNVTNSAFYPYPGGVAHGTIGPGLTLPDFAAMGGKSQYIIEFTAQGTRTFGAIGAGNFVWFNPALFLPSSYPPYDPTNTKVGFFFDLSELASFGATFYDMNYFVGTNDNNTHNYKCRIAQISATVIQIEFTFDFLFDVSAFHNNTLRDNLKRFTYNSPTAASPFTNITPAVYNQDKGFWYYLLVQDFAQTDPNNNYYIMQKEGNINARWYNVGTNNAAPDHTAVSLLFFDSSGNPTVGLNPIDDTTVQFIFSGNPVIPDKVFVKVLRSDAVDNSLDFEAAVVKGFAEIVTNAGVGTLDGAIILPSEKSYAAGNTTIKFVVDKTKIVNGGKYYLNYLVYHAAPNLWTSMLTDLLIVGQPTPEAIAPPLASDSIYDRLSVYQGDIKAPVQERLVAEMEIDWSQYTTDIVAKYGAGSYNDQLQDVTITIIDNVTNEVLQVGYFSAGQITRTVSGGIFTYRYAFRLREDEINTWAGRQLKLLWEQRFLLPKTLTGLDQDHIDHIYLEQFVLVRDYDDVTGSTGITSIALTRGSNGGTLNDLCGEDFFVATVNAGSANAANLIAFIDSRFYSADTILEEEDGSWGSPPVPVLINDTLYDVDAAFAAQQATFKVDVSKLLNDQQYQVSAIIHYAIDPVL